MSPIFRLLAGSFLLLTLLLPAPPVQAGGIGYYPSGQVQWEYLYQDGQVREAKWYDEQGRLNARSIFHDGRQTMSEGYRSDGSLEWQGRELADGRQEITRFAAGRRPEMRYELDRRPGRRREHALLSGGPAAAERDLPQRHPARPGAHLVRQRPGRIRIRLSRRPIGRHLSALIRRKDS